MRELAISVTLLLVAAASHAHPNHAAGHDGGVVHYASDPFHLAVAALTIGAGALCIRAWRARRPRSLEARARR